MCKLQKVAGGAHIINVDLRSPAKFLGTRAFLIVKINSWRHVIEL